MHAKILNKTRPGLVALYDIRPGNGAGQFLQPRSPHGASVIKIRLKTNSSHPAFQDHSRSLEPTWIDPPSMIYYLCSIVTVFLRHTVFEIFDFKNSETLKTELGSVKIIGNVTKAHVILTFYSNYGSISWLF